MQDQPMQDDDAAHGDQARTSALGRDEVARGRSGRRCRASSRASRTSCDTAITVLLAEGHLLIEDVPGVGKTMLAKALARSIDCSVRRIQFTPDLLPSDITGVSVFNQDVRDFEFRPGAIFANVVVGDEINRASPKTQSALLECMEERQVTVDGTTYHAASAVHGDRHPEPDRDGGHLPPARGPARPVHGADLDGLPLGRAPSSTMLDTHGGASPAGRPDSRSPTPTTVGRADRDGARRSTPRRRSSSTSSTSSTATRQHPGAAARRLPARHPAPAARRRGPTPRWPAATTCCPTTCRRSSVPVLAHRLIPTGETQLARRTTADVLSDLLRRVPVPAASPLRRPPCARLRDVAHHPGRGRSSAAGITSWCCPVSALGFPTSPASACCSSRLPLLGGAACTRATTCGSPSSARPRPGASASTSTPWSRSASRTPTARRTPMLMAEERLDYALGDRPRFVAARAAPRRACRRCTTRSARTLRGRHRLGPLGVRVRDPFGLTTRIAPCCRGPPRSSCCPRSCPLGGGHPPGSGVGAEGAIPHMVALHGEDDVPIREYRDGDDLRRIHWPATARTGELMVRQEDRPGPATCGRRARLPRQRPPAARAPPARSSGR